MKKEKPDNPGGKMKSTSRSSDEQLRPPNRFLPWLKSLPPNPVRIEIEILGRKIVADLKPNPKTSD